MKTNNTLTMPSNYSVLSEDQMMNNNSGWYVNVAQKKAIVIKSDITTLGIPFLQSVLEKVGINSENIDLSSILDKLASLGDDNMGVCIQYGDSSLNISWDLSEEELELAASNKFSLF